MTKKEIEKTMKLPGKVRGASFRTDAAFVLEKKGKKGLELLEKKTQEMGHPIDYGKISAVAWYPIGLRMLSLLAMREAFGWGNKEMMELGDFAPKHSFIFKIMVRYFLSKRHAFKGCPKFWKMYYNTGDLEPVELDEETHTVIRIRGLKAHPIFCAYAAGFFRRAVQFLFKVERTTVEETKCVFKGDPYHEFIIRWK